MIIIKLPQSLPEQISGSAVVSPAPALHAAKMLREVVLTLPFWKTGAELARVDAFLEIEAALEASPEQPKVSSEARALLKEAMQLLLPGGQFASLPDPRANRFYMRIFRAVLIAGGEEA